MDEQAVGDFEGALGQVFVGAVDGVAGLEGGDGLPAALGKGLPGLGRGKAEFGEFGFVVGVDDVNRTGEAGVALLLRGGDAGVRFIFGAIDVGDFDGLAIITCTGRFCSSSMVTWSRRLMLAITHQMPPTAIPQRSVNMTHRRSGLLRSDWARLFSSPRDDTSPNFSMATDSVSSRAR